jgi:hypothetical protein
MLAPAVHGDLEPRATEESIHLPHGDVDLSVHRLRLGNEAPAGRLQKLERLPSLQALDQLLGKALRVASGSERLTCHDPRRLMVTVTVAGCPAEHRNHDLGPESPDHLHNVCQERLAGPERQRLGRGLGVPEVERTREILPPTIQGPRCLELPGTDDSETLEELRTDEILPPVAPREGEVRRLRTLTQGHLGQEPRILVVRVGTDHEHTLHPLEPPEEQPSGHGPHILRHLRP